MYSVQLQRSSVSLTLTRLQNAINKQLKDYDSWKPDPEALAIGKTLQKIQEDKSKCILITPDWPTQP